MQLENVNRGMSYRPEFKEWVKEHPKAMAKAVRLIEKLAELGSRSNGDASFEGDVRVTHMKQPFSDVFKVAVGPDTFFVKRDKERLNIPGVHTVGGQSEYSDSLLARNGLKDDPDIDVVDFKLGYTSKDPKNPIAYFVSTWEDLQTVGEYMRDPNLDPQEKLQIEQKIKKAQRLFAEFHDVDVTNMFYDPTTKKIKMFDLNMNPNFS